MELGVLYSVDIRNSNSKPMWGYFLVTKSVVIFPSFSESRPKQKKAALPPSANGRFSYFIVSWESLCRSLLTVLPVCQGLAFFPALPLKRKFLSFSDEYILQGCYSITHLLVFTCLLIFGSLEISPTFMLP